MNEKGIFCISLDFEMLYGVSDLDNQEAWKNIVNGGREAIPKILDLFEKNSIHASWCIVGMLMAENKNQLLNYIPNNKPNYKEKRRTNYNFDLIGENEEEDSCHYAGAIIDKICKVENQEIASHTFSHYYCMDEGQTIENFVEDIDAAVRLAHDKNFDIKSIVFPKNQVRKNYIKELGKKGFIAYRGTEKSRIYTGARSGGESIFKRLARLCDNYINFSGMNCYRVSELEVDFGVVNVQSSRFLRPYMPLLKFIEPLRIHRIKKQMEYAAKEGKMFHLWWHPHNFGKNTNKNMDNLREILNWYTYLRKKYGMQSMNMQEVAKERLKFE